MGSEQFVVLNPKGNNKLLRVTTIISTGRVVRLAELRPGQSFRSEKPSITITEIPFYPTLDATPDEEGVFSVV